MKSRTLEFGLSTNIRILLVLILVLQATALSFSTPQAGKQKKDDPLIWKPDKPEPKPKPVTKPKPESKQTVRKGASPPPKPVIPAPPPPPVAVARTPRETVLDAMVARKDDPWSRANTHAILAIPGSAEKDKAYFEPGGSFSPSVKSFGISLWITDTLGNVKATSETLPNSNPVTHKLLWPDNAFGLPAIKTESWAYHSTWSSMGPGKWLLDVNALAGASAKVYLMVRSVGPAGGEINTLRWDGTALLINNRWGIRFDQTLSPNSVRIGQEGDKDWARPMTNAVEQKFDTGWGFARIDLSSAAQWKIKVSELAEPPPPALNYTSTKATLDLDLPDSTFKESLQAQVAHLMMGLDGFKVWAGDPTSYRERRPREAAYTIVALARAGQMEIARELLRELMEKGVFGATENDTPGLALWAAEEIAARVNQSDCDHQLWPLVAQKAELVMRLVPTAPVLLTNAMNYRGMLSAASFAERYKKADEAKRWRMRAQELKITWKQNFIPQLESDDRPFIVGLWPSGIAVDGKEGFLQGLQKRWQATHDGRGGFRKAPANSFVEIADAHQWLFLDKPDKSWETLRWYWNKQPIPGLYTWGDTLPPESQNKEQNKWEQIRGWVNPAQVSPHYGTAAELLLLQLEMLGYYNEASQELVIGAGVPPAWVNLPMSVNGLSTSLGEIGWDWNEKKKEMVVSVPSKQLRDRLKNKVRLGVNFPLKGKKQEIEIKVVEPRPAVVGTSVK